MVPLAVPARVPMATGLPNEPLAFESWAVNTLPAVKLTAVNGTLTGVPAQ